VLSCYYNGFPRPREDSLVHFYPQVLMERIAHSVVGSRRRLGSQGLAISRTGQSFVNNRYGVGHHCD
jgi:hypothetical protein